MVLFTNADAINASSVETSVTQHSFVYIAAIILGKINVKLNKKLNTIYTFE